MKCPNCGQEISDTSKFCGNCGAKIVTEQRCSKCGMPFKGRFCPSCGEPAGKEDVSDSGATRQIPRLNQNIYSQSSNSQKNVSQKNSSPNSSIRTLLIVLIVLVLIAIIGLMANSGTDESSSSSISQKDSSNQSTVSNKSLMVSSSSSQSSKAEEKISGVGDTIEYDGLKFTLDSVTEYVDKSDYPLDKPEAGNKFILLNFTISNGSGEDKHVNLFYEDSYCDDISIDPEIMLVNVSGDTIWGDLANGKKKKGYVAYQVPSDWETLEFQYQVISFSSSTEKVIFQATSNDVK